MSKRRHLGPATIAALLTVASWMQAARAAEDPPGVQAIDEEAPSAAPLPPPGRERAPRRMAREPEAPSAVPRDVVYLLVGLGTPVGGIGFEGVRRLADWLEVAGGVGVGDGAAGSEPRPSLGHVLQWSVMPRLRVGAGRHALTLGVGVSGGQFGSNLCIACDEAPASTYETHYTIWSNFEAGGEHLSHSGLAFRYFVGVAHGTAVGVAAPERVGTVTLPYFGVGLGYAF